MSFLHDELCFSAALLLMKAFSYIGFFVIIVKPPCWVLREAGLRTSSMHCSARIDHAEKVTITH